MCTWHVSETARPLANAVQKRRRANAGGPGYGCCGTPSTNCKAKGLNCPKGARSCKTMRPSIGPLHNTLGEIWSIMISQPIDCPADRDVATWLAANDMPCPIRKTSKSEHMVI